VSAPNISVFTLRRTPVEQSLGLAVHNDCHVVLLLGHLHDNLLRLGVGVLGGDDLGNSGAVFSVLVTRQLLRYVPGPARSRRR
jgi:hypothetical protein